MVGGVRDRAVSGCLWRRLQQPGAEVTGDNGRERRGWGSNGNPLRRAVRDEVDAGPLYRYAADQALDTPFASPVWSGIEDGLLADLIDQRELRDLSAWQLDGGYAERSAPLSPLDVLASSGGYYEIHSGIVPTCPAGNDRPPPELASLRVISLTAPRDAVSACSEWWSVTLFLGGARIRGVALRLGAP